MMNTAMTLLVVGLLARSAWTDIFHRRIPNSAVVLIVLLWPLHASTLEPQVAAASVFIAVSVLVLGVMVWLAGWLGAGDAKLLTAVALWAGPAHLSGTLLVTVLAGGVIAVGLLTARRWATLLPASRALAVAGSTGTESATLRPKPASRSVPYGVAIAVGGFWLACRLIAG